MKKKTYDNVFEQGEAEILEALKDYSTDEGHNIFSTMVGISSVEYLEDKELNGLNKVEEVLGQFDAEDVHSIVLFMMTHYEMLMNYERYQSEQKRAN